MEKLLIFVFLELAIIFEFCLPEKLKIVYATVPNQSVYLETSLYVEVVEPEEIAYVYKIRPARNFGDDFPKQFFGVDLVPTVPYQACSPLGNRQLVSGSVALVERGGCSFVSKTLTAQAAGAIAILITDNDYSNDQNYIDMIQDDTERVADIPSLFMLGKDGYMIKQALDSFQMSAVINIPINITGVPLNMINQPPWTLW